VSLSWDDEDGICSSPPPQASRLHSIPQTNSSLKLTGRMTIGRTNSAISIKTDKNPGRGDAGRAGEREPVVWVSKKEEFDHLESIIRDERKIQRQHKKDRVEQEYDPRKECLRSYADL